MISNFENEAEKDVSFSKLLTKLGEKINKYTPSEDQSSSRQKGKRVGIAYELENGEIIYVPE